jgi:dTDP-4-dehydrorhamnose reductase
MMATKTILVAGREGQLARCLQDLAARRNLSLAAIGRPDLDVEDVGSIERTVTMVEPLAIINAAAYTAVDRAEAEPSRAYAVNRDGAGHLAAVAVRRGIPLVHVSTDYVFDGRKPCSYRENDVPAPLNVYGRSKLEGELAVRKTHPQAVVVRSSWIYSPYGHNFVRTILRLSEYQSPVRVVDDQRGTPTSASDLAAAILEMVRQLTSGNRGENAGTYHLAGQGEATWHSFAGSIFAGLASRGRRVPLLQAITTEQYSTRTPRPANSCLDSSKAESVFGIRLAAWQESLEECLDQLMVRGAPWRC